jgi:hypothetical protein
MALLGMHVVLTPAHKSSRRPAIYPECMRRIPLQFPGFGAMHVITRAIAGKVRQAVKNEPAGFLSTLITRGTPLPGELWTLRKKRLAPAASHLAVSRKSMVWTVESTARYRYLSSPLTFI